MQHVGIPKFDANNELHKKLSEISQKCHKLKLNNDEIGIRELEAENDKLVLELFKSKGKTKH
jgi:hypothetical protein